MSSAASLCALDPALQGLVSAEEFLEYFEVAYDLHVVQVNRLHILQRFHDYLEQEPWQSSTQGAEAQRERCARLLERAYQDFVSSDARTEKVFEVFRRTGSATANVSLDSLRK